MGIFMKMGSFGAIFVTMLMIFIIGTGVMGFQQTEYTFVGLQGSAEPVVWDDPDSVRSIAAINKNFSPIAGILCAGYFLHTCSLQIMRSAKYPEKNIRNLFISYSLVFTSYAVVGTFGYIGFVGTYFSNYFVSIQNTKTEGQIDQNCLNMFDYTNIPAFVLRIAIFCLLFSTYPLINHFLSTMILNLFWRNQ
jgi:hypothetical protein